LSVEEKRVKLLEIFHETKDFFTLKELERLAAKRGVVSQTVKDVLQTLVDDNLVELDKIGISNFYWSFPSARGSALTNKTANSERELMVLESRETELKASIAASRAERLETTGREELLSSWNALKSSVAARQSELAQYTGSGGIDAKARGLVLAQEAASRWTENLSIAIQYISVNFSLPAEDVHRLGGIPDDFEEFPPP